tara:strand:+ start:361 stop:471 length:111 start_codon:yes stop_codon:yes gene_type:complete
MQKKASAIIQNIKKRHEREEQKKTSGFDFSSFDAAK